MSFSQRLKTSGVVDKDTNGSQDFKEFDQGACAC
jgi:hypothetical protein